MGLSAWQLKRQLAWLAAQAAWEETPQGLVYTGGGFVSEDLEGNFRMGSVNTDGPVIKTGTDNAAGDTPFCRVRCLRSEWDRGSNDSRIERAVFQLWSSAGGGAVPGTPTQAGFDSHGINQVTGANRASPNGQGQSQGRDVDELISRLVETYGGHFIDSVHGFQGRASATDVMRKVNGSMVLKRALEVEAFNCLQSNYYHPAISGTFGVSGSNLQVTSLVGPPERYDSARLQLNIFPGSIPTNPNVYGARTFAAIDATSITLAIPFSGAWGYALWVCYDETNSGTDERYSNPLTGFVIRP